MAEDEYADFDDDGEVPAAQAAPRAELERQEGVASYSDDLTAPDDFVAEVESEGGDGEYEFKYYHLGGASADDAGTDHSEGGDAAAGRDGGGGGEYLDEDAPAAQRALHTESETRAEL